MRVNERKTMIILGGDAKRGAGIAVDLGAADVNIVIPFTGNSKLVNKAITEIEAKGGIAIALFTDVCEPSHLSALCQTTLRAFGRVDAVVCSFGRQISVSAPSAITILSRMQELLREQGQSLDLYNHEAKWGDQALAETAKGSADMTARLRRVPMDANGPRKTRSRASCRWQGAPLA